MVSLLTALALAQVIPASASVVYPCFPETPSRGSVKCLTHAVTFKINQTTIEMESLSTFKNAYGPANIVEFQLPTRAMMPRHEQITGISISAMLDKAPLALRTSSTMTSPPENRKASGVWATSYNRIDAATIPFKVGQTRSLSIKWSAPLGRAGLDMMQRMVAYDTAGASYWDGAIGQMNVAIQYREDLILTVFAALPDKQWQVGPKGAFLKKYDFLPAKKPHLIFTYYPQKID